MKSLVRFAFGAIAVAAIAAAAFAVVTRDPDGAGPLPAVTCPDGTYTGSVDYDSGPPPTYTVTQAPPATGVITIPIDGDLSDKEKKGLDHAVNQGDNNNKTTVTGGKVTRARTR